ncbi:MAG: hypothetical protein ACLQUY_15085 [Ktedonobacterales bacterium]
MTTATAANYERALNRAHTEQLIITGSSASANLKTVFVQHPDDATGIYTVSWRRGAHHLTCSCQAGQRNVACKHEALAREYWLAELPDPTYDADNS